MSVSSVFREAVNAPQTEKVFLVLLTIDHAQMSEPIRVVNNTQNVTSRDHEFIGFPFEINLPDQRDDQLPEVTLTICNVDRQLVLAVRSISGPPSVTLEVILADAPDTVEISLEGAELRSTDYDALTISGKLTFEPILGEPIPGDLITPGNFPGVFK